MDLGHFDSACHIPTYAREITLRWLGSQSVGKELSEDTDLLYLLGPPQTSQRRQLK